MSDEGEVNSDVIAEAKTMGWVPEEEFKGPKENWIDADEFVEKGRHVMPILLANNKRLQQELLTRTQKIDTLLAEVTNTKAGVAVLEKHYQEATKRAVAAERERLMGELKTAREDDDVEGEEKIREQLADLKASEKAADKPLVAPVTKDPDDNLSPDFKAWLADNDWFNTDHKRAKKLSRIGEDLREDGDTTEGRAFMDKCLTVLLEQEGEGTDTSGASKVETRGARGGGQGGGGKAQTFASLPAEAKQACWSDNDDLVGPDKLFKTQKDWEVYYAKSYWSQS